jgi:hypothetical protein
LQRVNKSTFFEARFMSNEASSKKKTTRNEELDTSTADRGIIPAEVAARMDREGADYRSTAEEQADPESINVTGGATVDQEGLANNYAIEPEMYVNEPGDLRQEEEQLAAERNQELAEANKDKQGELTEEGDKRGRGPGLL